MECPMASFVTLCTGANKPYKGLHSKYLQEMKGDNYSDWIADRNCNDIEVYRCHDEVTGHTYRISLLW